MVNEAASRILQCLQSVAEQRALRAADAGLAARVREIKRYQHTRFATTYADLLSSPRYARAAQFFLDDLYGPGDFSARDDQFARIVPGLTRLFPHEIVETVRGLGELHALSERLDTAMGRVITDFPEGQLLDAASYGRAWRDVGEPELREQQISLMLAVGSALDRYTRNPLLRHSLRLMRAPAHAAGLGALQSFLENGFDTFRQMRGATEFLATIATRERELAVRLFADKESGA